MSPLRPSCEVKVTFVSFCLLLLSPRASRAEDSLTVKAQSWQEDKDRIRVDSQYAQIDKDLGTDTHLKVMGLLDSIAGATPTGERPATGKIVPKAHMEDRRKAWTSDLAHQFKRVNVSVGYGVSRESDYVSYGWSVNTVTDFNDKNTTLTVGYGGTKDTIAEWKLNWTKLRHKDGSDFIVGVTQLLNPNTSVTANVVYGLASGYMSDPYKIVSTTRLDLDPGTYYTPPENRPDEKKKISVFLGLNRNFERLHAAVDCSYRHYHDSFGITSHTVALEWIQKFGEHWIVQPSVRFYRQSASDFYYYNLDRSRVVTTYEPVLAETGTGHAPFYSSDYRLSHLETIDGGLKIVYKVTSWLALNVSYDRYTMRGLDGLTPQDAYTKANMFVVGVKLTR
ncbi:MAG: DUF3570 domain-containing protein [Nibricoccus sp.]